VLPGLDDIALRALAGVAGKPGALTVNAVQSWVTTERQPREVATLAAGASLCDQGRAQHLERLGAVRKLGPRPVAAHSPASRPALLSTR
jgi:hypothetical protein